MPVCRAISIALSFSFTMSRPLEAKVHRHQNSNNKTIRSSWYHDDNNYNDHNDDKNDDGSSSSSSVSYENSTVPCWGGWLWKLAAQAPGRPRASTLLVVRKPSSLLKVLASSSSTTTDDDDDLDDEYDDDDDQESDRSRTPPPCPPSVSAVSNEPDTELSDEMQMIRQLQIEGDRLEQEGLLLDALNVHQRLLELLRATGQSANQIGKVHYRTGMIQYKRHHTNEALCHFDQALFIYQLNYDPDQDEDADIDEDDDDNMDDMALDFYRVYVATGHVHLTNHNPYRAMDYFQRALQFVKPEPQLSSTMARRNASRKRPYYAQALQALGTAYEAIGDDAEAQRYYQNAAVAVAAAPGLAVTTTTQIE